MKNRILAAETSKKVGENITVAGWVHSRRDHGGLIFIDLRDHTGLVQLVINPDKKDAFSLAESLRDEFVVRACGVVAERGEGLKNPNIASGDVEIVVDNLEVLAEIPLLKLVVYEPKNKKQEEILRKLEDSGVMVHREYKKGFEYLIREMEEER